MARRLQPCERCGRHYGGHDRCKCMTDRGEYDRERERRIEEQRLRVEREKPTAQKKWHANG